MARVRSSAVVRAVPVGTTIAAVCIGLRARGDDQLGTQPCFAVSQAHRGGCGVGASSSAVAAAWATSVASGIRPHLSRGSSSLRLTSIDGRTRGGSVSATVVGFVASLCATCRGRGNRHGLVKVACRVASSKPEEETPSVSEDGTESEEEGNAKGTTAKFDEEVAGAAEFEELVEAEKVEAKDEDKKDEKKPQKWTCSGCGASNFASVNECHKCGSYRPSEAELALMDEKKAAREEVSKVMDGFLRLQADLQNYRRQHNESMSRATDLGKQDALRDLVPLTDDINAALVQPEGMTEKAAKLFASYSLLFKKVTDTYSKFGVEPLSTKVGEKFDPLNHVKVQEREAPADEAPGTILEVLKPGWKWEGKTIIRSEIAMVAFPVIAKEEDDEDQEMAGTDEELVADDASPKEPVEEKEDGEAKEDREEVKA